ncbi:hypothetical protein BC832DRAFT_560295 [Gaertneriomyces semiglobifer]|nr:hypothetical protein BC832DRAFT_560295 [Gaertneriomyces semiglobifer]
MEDPPSKKASDEQSYHRGSLTQAAIPGRRMSLAAVLAMQRNRRPTNPTTSSVMTTTLGNVIEKGGDSRNSMLRSLQSLPQQSGESGIHLQANNRFDAITALRRLNRLDNPQSIHASLPGFHRDKDSSMGSLTHRSTSNNQSRGSLWNNSAPTVADDPDQLRTLSSQIPHPAMRLNLIPSDPATQSIFHTLCNDLLIRLGDVETAIEELIRWKDAFLTQTVPSSVKLDLGLLFARVVRAKTELHEPLFELVKQVRVYGSDWRVRKDVLVELERDFLRQNHIIDIAILKMEHLEIQVEQAKSAKRVAVWERLTKRLMDMFPDVIGDQYLDAPPETQQDQAEETASSSSGSEMSSEYLVETPSRYGSMMSSAVSLGPRSRVSSHVSTAPSVHEEQQQPPAVPAPPAVLNEEPLRVSKSAIRESLQQSTPMYKHTPMRLFNRFRTLLRAHHPDLALRLSLQHRHPFRPPRPLYLSLTTRTVAYPTPNKSLRRGWSACDLDKGYAETKRLVRSNSDGALEVVRGGKVLKRGERALMPRFGTVWPVSSAGEGEDEDEDEVEWVGEELEYEAWDEHFSLLQSAGTDLSDTVNRFMETTPMLKRDTTSPQTPHLPTDKSSFTLEDLMELTLLHAQQMQLLQTEYNERIAALEQQIEASQVRQSGEREEYEQRIEQLQERTKRLAAEFMKQARESESREGRGRREEDEEEEEAELSAIGEALRNRSGRSGRRRGKSRGADRSKTPVHLVQKILAPRETPVFTSAPFQMSFLSRLRHYTAERLAHHEALAQKINAMEQKEVEEKLGQYNLLDDKTLTHQTKKEDAKWLARFMPMPGEVPKRRKAPGEEQGLVPPWGGKFAITKKSDDDADMNILNLFDVAMRMTPGLPKASRIVSVPHST